MTIDEAIEILRSDTAPAEGLRAARALLARTSARDLLAAWDARHQAREGAK